MKTEDDAISLPDPFPLPKHCCLAEPHPLLRDDDVSCGRHNCVLLVEFNKGRLNEEVVSALMGKTFPMRRKVILDKPCDLDSLFKDYPFLQMVNR